MNDPVIEIGADGINAAKVMAEIRAVVDAKTAAGVYRDARIARAERGNLVNLKDDEAFLRYYLECLRNAVLVDINDFPIRERRRLGAGLLVIIKKTLWKLLKFYTYRLWSQQNQANSLLIAAVEGLEEKTRLRLRDLESRIAALEKEKCPPPNA